MANPQIGMFLAASVLTIGSGLATADVLEFNVAKIQFFEQDSASPPASPLGFVFNAYADMLEDDANAVSVNGLVLDNPGPGEWNLEVEFATKSELDAAFPSDETYFLHLEGGDLGARDEIVQFDTPESYPATPALTASSFGTIQNAPAGQDLTIEWVQPDAETNLVAIAVVDLEWDDSVIDLTIDDPAQTQLVVPAGTLLHGRTYYIELVFAHALTFSGTPEPGFGADAFGLTGFAAITVIGFQTEPCQVDLNDDGELDFFDVLEFLSLYTQGSLDADFAMDGMLDFFDVLAFLGDYTEGCS